MSKDCVVSVEHGMIIAALARSGLGRNQEHLDQTATAGLHPVDCREQQGIQGTGKDQRERLPRQQRVGRPPQNFFQANLKRLRLRIDEEDLAHIRLEVGGGEQRSDIRQRVHVTPVILPRHHAYSRADTQPFRAGTSMVAPGESGQIIAAPADLHSAERQAEMAIL
jgi:hypothetical protein